jgi:hypothetical protein
MLGLMMQAIKWRPHRNIEKATRCVKPKSINNRRTLAAGFEIGYQSFVELEDNVSDDRK